MEAGHYDASSASNFLGTYLGNYLDASGDEELLIHLQQSVTESSIRYDECFRSLQLAIGELEELQDENRLLREQFVELSLRDDEKDYLDGGCTGSNSRGGGAGGKETGTRRGTPKCISIRSPAFLAVKSKGGTATGASALMSRGGGKSDSAGCELKLPHRILLPIPTQGNGEKNGGTEEAPSLQVDVYTQGMTKTELCNKWEELGWCPYGTQCQFAHGIEELRPVIRHPRYKTQLCRMLDRPGGCPYGHRCHFLHPKSPSSDNSNCHL